MMQTMTQPTDLAARVKDALNPAPLPHAGRGIRCVVCGLKPWSKGICDLCGAAVCCLSCCRGWFDAQDTHHVQCNPCRERAK